MTSLPHSVGLEQPLEVAHQLMAKHGFHHLPVQEGGKLVGVISDRDVKYATGWSKGSQKPLFISDVYTPDPYVVLPTSFLGEVLRRMVAEHIGCALVAEKGDTLLGIFTTTDACRHLAKLLERSS